jgi:site-specific DNA-methyltransferase (adenine-specific)
MKTIHKIINGDSRQMSEIDDKVEEVISPELIRLNNDLIIRLIGIKQKPAVNGKATEFLREKLKGKRVFMRHDEVKHDGDNYLMAYLYLENKMFINAHLLKEGLAEVDEGLEFRNKSKFLKITQI